MLPTVCCILIAYCLPIDAHDRHTFSHNVYGSWTMAKGPRSWVLKVPAHSSSGLGSMPISVLAEHLHIKGNQYVMNRQYETGNTLILYIYIYMYIYIEYIYIAYCLFPR